MTHRVRRAQQLLQSTRTAGLVGSALGVMVGCLIGMFPLFFMPDSEVVEAVKRKEKVREIPGTYRDFVFAENDDGLYFSVRFAA